MVLNTFGIIILTMHSLSGGCIYNNNITKYINFQHAREELLAAPSELLLLKDTLEVADIVNYPLDSTELPEENHPLLSSTRAFLRELRYEAFGYKSDLECSLQKETISYLGNLHLRKGVLTQAFLFNYSQTLNIRKTIVLITIKNGKVIGMVNIRVRYIDMDWGQSTIVNAVMDSNGELIVQQNHPADIAISKEAMHELSKKEVNRYNYGGCARFFVSKKGKIKLKR